MCFLSLIVDNVTDSSEGDAAATESRGSSASAVCSRCVFDAAVRNDARLFEQLLRSGPLESLYVPLLLSYMPKDIRNRRDRTGSVKKSESFKELLPLRTPPQGFGSCDHVRFTNDYEWEHSVSNKVESAYIVWSVPIYMLLHKQFQMIDLLCKHSQTHWSFAAPFKMKNFVRKLEAESSIPGPLRCYLIHYIRRSSFTWLNSLSPKLFDYLLRKAPQLSSTVLEYGDSSFAETTLAWSLLRATDERIPVHKCW